MKKRSCQVVDKSLVTVLTILLMSPGLSIAEDGTTEALEEFGDIMQLALPLAALGTTYVLGDEEGSKQFYKSFFTALGTTTTLKGVYSKLRPKSKSRTSFPSGHTTAAFAGAAFIDGRYGHTWGAIAYTAAGLTGYSRIRSENHFADDVLAGASIAMMSNWLWTTPYDSNVMIAPVVMGDGVGLSFTVKDEVGEKQHGVLSGDATPKMRYQLMLGGAGLKRNYITAPSATGTTFNLHNFELQDDPITSAVGSLEWYVSSRGTWRFSIWPFESRDNGQFTQPVNFAGSTFPAATSINSAWRHYDFRTTYVHNFLSDRDWHFGLGAALTAQFTEIDLQTEDNSVNASVDDQVVLPLLHASLGYRISRNLKLITEVNGVSLSDDKLLDANLLIRYELNHYWDAGFGVSMYERNINTSELKNDIRYNSAYFLVGYTFY